MVKMGLESIQFRTMFFPEVCSAPVSLIWPTVTSFEAFQQSIGVSLVSLPYPCSSSPPIHWCRSSCLGSKLLIMLSGSAGRLVLGRTLQYSTQLSLWRWQNLAKHGRNIWVFKTRYRQVVTVFTLPFIFCLCGGGTRGTHGRTIDELNERPIR
jgi:hypothetical protein